MGVAQTLFSSIAQDYVKAHGWMKDRREGRMMGDPGFHRHRTIEASVAHRWRRAVEELGLPNPRWRAVSGTSDVEAFARKAMGAINFTASHNPPEYNGLKFCLPGAKPVGQDTGLDEIWADTIAAKPHRAQYGLDKGEYGVNMTRLARWVRSMVGIDQFNFGVTAHPLEIEDPVSEEMKLQPYVQGKNMSTKVQGYMNLVAYYEKKNTGKGDDKKLVRVLRFEGSDRYVAKDQFDAFAEGRMVNPTMPKIMAAVEASRPKTTARKTTTKRTAASRRRRTTS